MAGCGTARYGRRAGEELFGLTRSLMRSGASNVISSLWDIDEVAMIMFFECFYKSLEDGTPAEAFKHSQNFLRQVSAREVIDSLSVARNDISIGSAVYYRLLLSEAKMRALHDGVGGEQLCEKILAESPQPAIRSKAKILKAQIKLIGDADRRSLQDSPFGHPFYWAPFVLLGRG
jgi:CHAT domain-containing protein